MLKIKNPILLGLISGIATAFISGALNAAEYKRRLIDVNYNQISAALFLPKNKSKKEFSGSIMRYLAVSVISTLICYLLPLTGRKNMTVKSMGIILPSWLLFAELIPKFLLKMKIRKPLYHCLSFLDHMLSAMIISKIILKYGDKSLFAKN